MEYQNNGSAVPADDEGYLQDVNLWSRELADQIAGVEQIDLTEQHWEIVDYIRNYYDEYKVAPAIRMLTKLIKKDMGPDKGNPTYLFSLFPEGPAKQAAKIAGLPKPPGCS